eukprot:302781-Prorocentrum_minimum.AAC.1
MGSVQATARVNGAFQAARLLPTRQLPWSHPMRLVPSPRGALTSLKVTLADVGADLNREGAGLLPSVPSEGGGFSQPRLVTIDVHAVGLNFRDVLNVLGMYP